MPAGQQPPPPSYGQPPGYPQQPAYWPVYPSTPRPRRRWVLWVVLTGILAVGGCGALAATFGVRAYHDIDGARTTANAFLSAAERGDRSSAQSLLCDEPAAFTVERATMGGVVAHRITGVSLQSSFGSRRSAHKSVNVTVDLTLDGGAHRRDVLIVVREHDDWRVCDVFRFGGPVD